MKLLSWLSLSLVLVLSAPAAADEAAAVEAAVIGLFDAMRAHDQAGIRAAFDPSARLGRVGDDGSLKWSAVDTFASSIAAGKDSEFDERIHDVAVQVDGNLAQAWTPYRFFLDGVLSHCGTNAFILAKGDDGWRIASLIDISRRDGCAED